MNTHNTYILVEWPDSQSWMEEDWFRDEAILAEGETVGSSAYFIPEHRILTNDYILTRIQYLTLQMN